jgi:hypothetical protein
MNKNQIKSLIESGYNRADRLNNVSWNHYVDQMLQSELKGERNCRNEHPTGSGKPKFGPSIAAKYFVVKWLLEAMQDCSIQARDVLFTRHAALMAKGIADAYPLELAKAFDGFDVEAFDAIDYVNDIA